MRTLPIWMLVAALVTPTLADTKFLDTFKAPEAANFSFWGQKVAALVVSDDLSLRQSAESELARRLTARGMRGVETYRIVPAPETRNPARARAFLEQSEVQGVVVIRPLRLTSERAPDVPVMWSSPMYGGLWDYWGYGWGAVYQFTPERRDMVLVTETLIYSLPLGKLMWAAVTKTKNPQDAQAYVRGLVEDTVNEMRKQGLAAGR